MTNDDHDHDAGHHIRTKRLTVIVHVTELNSAKYVQPNNCGVLCETQSVSTIVAMTVAVSPSVRKLGCTKTEKDDRSMMRIEVKKGFRVEISIGTTFDPVGPPP